MTTQEQLRLPTCLGGCAIPVPTKERAMAAYLATHLAHAEGVAQLSKQLGVDWIDEQSRMAADECVEHLREQGVHVREGHPALTMQARDEYAAGPWNKDTRTADVFSTAKPVAREGPDDQGSGNPGHCEQSQAQETPTRSNLFGQLLRGINAMEATRLHKKLNPHRQQCLLSGGGLGTGAMWTMVPAAKSLRMSNAIWSMALQRRLGIAEVPEAGLTCKIANSSGGEPCGLPLDRFLHHCAVCGQGGGRQRAHNGVMTILQRHVASTGAFTEQEKAVPELYEQADDGRIKERFMDLVVQWPGGKRHLIDVTIRTPFAKDLRDAENDAGCAAREGELDKKRHYGSEVWTLAIEPGGRLGVQAQQLMAVLNREATELGRLQEGTGKPGRLRVKQLRAEMEVEVCTCDAARCLTSLGTQAVAALGWAQASRSWKRSVKAAK